MGLQSKTGFAMPIAVTETDDQASSLSMVIDRARNRQLSLTELFQIAEGLKTAGQRKGASELYKTWIAYNADQKLVHLAYFNFSVALRELGDQAGAINALRECIRLDPTFGPARINLGRSLEDSGQTTFAVGQWQELVDGISTVTPEHVGHKLMALQHIGRVLENAELLAKAEEALKQAIELRPDKTEAGQHWLAIRQRQCKWPLLLPTEYVSSKQLLAAMSPMALAAYADDPMFQLAKAYKYNKSFVERPDNGPIAPRLAKNKVGAGERLRVGYVSSDLREHAVGFALSEVLELHDKAKFEIFAYYSGDARVGDSTQARIKSAAHNWCDIGGMSDLQAATKIAKDKIDVLVDLNGYTKHARTKIFSYRPAPIIVNWCGYPGTMGSPYHQYLIADEHIIPPENEVYYSEKVLRIPCNQPIDRKRKISPDTPTRSDVGLPDTSFVYASFNGMQKLTANCFSRWMAILVEVPDSVLWLLAGTDETNERLRGAAAQRGVEPKRIFFAKKAANPQHLARLSLADLFLDTLPYGAHSTAADALTMGLPILTLQGRSFASRFCSSVVTAAGLQDLICATPEDYVRRAIAFGRNRHSLSRYRDLLQRGCDSSVLRDIPALVERLEDLFWEMQSDRERGATPVPDLANLDIYYEIGAELDLENIELLDECSYRKLYAERLAQWNEHTPIAPDNRFWPRDKVTDALEAVRPPLRLASKSHR